MPIYEYRCGRCSRVLSFLVRNVRAHRTPACPKCGAKEMTRVLSQFAALSGESKSSDGPDDHSPFEGGDEPEGMPDLSALEGLDEKDPRSLGRALRKMARETGEKMDPEMDEICRRLESGEDPEKIEENLDEALGGAGGGEGSDDTLYDA